MTDFHDLADLERLLSDVRDDHPTVAQEMSEALKLAGGARVVSSAVHIQLQGALASIRSGRPEDAVALIERAIEIGKRWTTRETHRPIATRAEET